MSNNAKPDPRHNIAQPDGKQVAPSQTATQRSTAETLTGLKRKQRELQNEVYGDLQFMLHHFVQLQSSDHTSTQVNAGNQQRLAGPNSLESGACASGEAKSEGDCGQTKPNSAPQRRHMHASGEGSIFSRTFSRSRKEHHTQTRPQKPPFPLISHRPARGPHGWYGCAPRCLRRSRGSPHTYG